MHVATITNAVSFSSKPEVWAISSRVSIYEFARANRLVAGANRLVELSRPLSIDRSSKMAAVCIDRFRSFQSATHPFTVFTASRSRSRSDLAIVFSETAFKTFCVPRFMILTLACIGVNSFYCSRRNACLRTVISNCLATRARASGE